MGFDVRVMLKLVTKLLKTFKTTLVPVQIPGVSWIDSSTSLADPTTLLATSGKEDCLMGFASKVLADELRP